MAKKTILLYKFMVIIINIPTIYVKKQLVVKLKLSPFTGNCFLFAISILDSKDISLPEK